MKGLWAFSLIQTQSRCTSPLLIPPSFEIIDVFQRSKDTVGVQEHKRFNDKHVLTHIHQAIQLILPGTFTSLDRGQGRHPPTTHTCTAVVCSGKQSDQRPPVTIQPVVFQSCVSGWALLYASCLRTHPDMYVQAFVLSPFSQCVPPALSFNKHGHTRVFDL